MKALCWYGKEDVRGEIVPDYHEGRDLRSAPYSLFRVRIDGTPVRLR